VLAVERSRLSIGGLLAIALFKDDFRRALDEQHLPAVYSLLQRRHELVLGFERNGVDTRRCGQLGLPVHTELCRERIQRAFRRIAFNLPVAFLLEQLRIVAEQGDPAHERKYRVVAGGLSIFF